MPVTESNFSIHIDNLPMGTVLLGNLEKVDRVVLKCDYAITANSFQSMNSPCNVIFFSIILHQQEGLNFFDVPVSDRKHIFFKHKSYIAK